MAADASSLQGNKLMCQTTSVVAFILLDVAPPVGQQTGATSHLHEDDHRLLLDRLWLLLNAGRSDMGSFMPS